MVGMPSGAKPGERRGGRQRGTLNKATVERKAKALVALTRQADASFEHRELAKDALMRLAIFAEGAAAATRPTTEADIKGGSEINPDGDWDRHKGWIELSGRLYKWAADFQSPRMLGIAMAPPPPPTIEGGEEQRVRMTLRVFEGGRMIKQIPAGQSKKAG